MKFTLSWLKEYLDTDASLEQITAKLTDIGLEVENIEDRGDMLAPFIIAYVESAEKHPNADRLRVCNVNTGTEVLQVVCGAPNARAGMKGVFAKSGVKIPRDNFELKKSNIRGVESNGMLCSASELKLGEDADGIIELPQDAPVGKPYAATYGLDDPVIEINLTPNRADCAGVYGIARDLAAAGLGKMKHVSAPKIAGKFKSPVDVKIETADCPQFALRYIKGVKNGPSPDWLQRRLRAIGLRPISALVDITNFFTVTAARPMHVFDADLVKGNLTIAEAKGGEKMPALNDKEYTLSEGMTVVNDNSGTISLAGIVGGASTGVSDKTQNVLLEVALWNPERIAKTGRLLEVLSDARYRFERGVDPAGVVDAVELATKMIQEFCGGEASEIVVAGKIPEWQRTISFRPARLKTLAGLELPAADIKKIFESLGFMTDGKGDAWKVTTPSWRKDVEGEADLVEEIIRIHGYDKVPALSLPTANVLEQRALSPLQRRAQTAKRLLSARGFLECVNFSFVDEEAAGLFGGGQAELKLLNPISSDLNVMRPSILPSLLAAVKRNAARGIHDQALCEVGAQYAGAKPDQQKTVAAFLRAGHEIPHRSPVAAYDAVDALSIKADVAALLSDCGVDVSRLQIAASGPDFYHPGQVAELKQGPNVLARFGAVHPKILKHFDIKGAVVAAEVFLDAVPLPKDKGGKTKPALHLSQFQKVERDFAFVVDEKVTAEQVVKAAHEADKQLITDAYVFDVFEGGNVGAGKKSIAFAVTIQPMDKTLTDAEIEAIAQKIIASVMKATGGVLRA